MLTYNYLSLRDTLFFETFVMTFFSQAEDGIRGLTVTGVQTCALPISMSWASRRRERDRGLGQERGIIESHPDCSSRKPRNLNPPDASVATPAATARIIPRAAHAISRSGISPNALRVLYRLREGGFQAFLVGGCVGDLRRGLEPKAFDVVTDALPEEVKRLFRNCRLVGRRFRLAD